jgi:hypothetical protein
VTPARPSERDEKARANDARAEKPPSDGRRSADNQAKGLVKAPSQDNESRAVRDYSWPPFAPGHTLSVRHGARSERAIEAKAQQVRGALFDAYPWLDEVQDAITVARFCRVEGRALMLQAGIDAYEDERGPGRAPEYLYERVNQTDQLADRIGSKLGLDPSGRAQLRQTVASTEATLSDLAARGAEINRRRDLARLEDQEIIDQERDQ